MVMSGIFDRVQVSRVSSFSRVLRVSSSKSARSHMEMG